MRSKQEAIQAIERYADTVRRICMLHLKNHADTEDIFQTVFLKYALYPGAFESDAHEKAWIIRVTVNACRDLLKSFFRSRTVSLDDVGEIACTDEHREVLEAVLALPAKYRDVVYLFYYEQYTASEIAALLRRSTFTRAGTMGVPSSRAVRAPSRLSQPGRFPATVTWYSFSRRWLG